MNLFYAPRVESWTEPMLANQSAGMKVRSNVKKWNGATHEKDEWELKRTAFIYYGLDGFLSSRTQCCIEPNIFTVVVVHHKLVFSACGSKYSTTVSAFESGSLVSYQARLL